MRLNHFAVTLTAALCLTQPASAASLRVAPVLIDLKAPTATSHINLWNDAQKPMNVQVRVFRWSQENGSDVLTPATDVVASPPITSVKPGGQTLVRIVRTAKSPVAREESYRLVVDELPAAGRQGSTVVMVVRHSIPVFFEQNSTSDASVDWSVAPAVGGYRVTAINKGDKRLKVANLSVKAGNALLGRRNGLVGYVLGRSSVNWFVEGKKFSGGAITVQGEKEGGSFHATAKLKGG
ncbi:MULTISPECIES: fimbrial biogenesis chaperone [unclassified Rhizobium]|uniref:fimbrial biogenesis chaperone n=1 Tax=unclassified Rhizobium TaxID=2613769 RepID=UPI00177F5354|nr:MULTISPECIES: molecular chaperone [unclassified Rhizobium]MBD8688851.1 molecular chaperone [Rhizobium sp. CFBP 13644]MBD8694178.1 molecular chaperone [Rhizobium sp. CFBP 13717]